MQLIIVKNHNKRNAGSDSNRMKQSNTDTGKIDERLLRILEKDYGDNYREHCLEIYKSYLESIENISDRRQSANSFFLSINTAIAGAVGYIFSDDNAKQSFSLSLIILSLSGVVICYTWYRLIKSYRQINSSKFKVLHEIEKMLPIAPFDLEWKTLGSGKDFKRYIPFTKVESIIPWAFVTLYLLILCQILVT